MKYKVYEYWRPDKNECFYVGKGVKSRITWHISDSKRRYPRSKNKLKINILKKLFKKNLLPDIKIVFETNNEKEALDKEIELIKQYGKIIDNSGPLCNLTDGGEGISGFAHSRRTKNIISKKNSGKNNPFYGKKHSDITIKILKEKLSGKNNPRFGKKNSKKQRVAASNYMKNNNNGKQGEEHPCSKMTKDLVLDLRKKAKQGLSNLDLAKLYNINPGSVWLIVNNHTWRNV